eukprot:403362711
MKKEQLGFKDISWDSIAGPTYFFMTEFLLVSIVSFVVFVNCLIQICCNSSKARGININQQLHQIQNNLQVQGNPLSQDRSSVSSIDGISMMSGASGSAVSSYTNEIKISIWFLYISIPGLLVLFLLLRNITQLDDLKKETGNNEVNILNNKGEMVLLYLFGILAISIAFFDQIKCWMAEMMINSDQDTLHYEYVVNLRRISHIMMFQSRQQILNRVQNPGERQPSIDGIEREQQQQELEKILKDPEINKIPKFFLKMSNSYFMSTQKYSQYLKGFLFKKRKKVTISQMTTTDIALKNQTNTRITNEPRVTRLGDTHNNLSINKKNDVCFCSNEKRNRQAQQTIHKHVFTEENYDDIYFKTAGKDIIRKEEQRRNSHREVDKLPHYLQSLEDNHNPLPCKESLPSSIQNVDCMICFSAPADSVIAPCGHGGVCFECCQKIIQDVVNKNQHLTYQTTKVYNFRCHLCRNLGLKIYQLDLDPLRLKIQMLKQRQSQKINNQQDQRQLCIPVKSYIDLIINPLLCINLNEDVNNALMQDTGLQTIEENKQNEDFMELDELDASQEVSRNMMQYIFLNNLESNLNFERHQERLETEKVPATSDIGFNKKFVNQQQQDPLNYTLSIGINIDVHSENGQQTMRFQLPSDIDENIDEDMQNRDISMYFQENDDPIRVKLETTFQQYSQ